MKKIILIPLGILMLGSSLAFGQPTTNSTNPEAKQLDDAAKTMLALVKPKIPKDGPCGADSSIFNSPTPGVKALVRSMNNIKGWMKDYNRLKYVKKGIFGTAFDEMFLSYDPKDNFDAFIKKTTGLEPHQLTKKQKRELAGHFLNIKALLTHGLTLDIKNKDKAPKDCYWYRWITYKIASKDHTGVQWEYTLGKSLTCNCESPKKESEIKKLYYVIKASAKGQFKAGTISFDKPTDATLEIRNKVCCGDTEVGFLEEPFIYPPKTENVSLPDHLLGGGVGVGFAQNFDETSFCIGGEYLYNLAPLGSNSLFAGVQANLTTSSFMDTSRTWVSVGPSVQLFSPVTSGGLTQITNGISGGYVFGTNDNGGFKDDVSGFEISLNTGFNIQVSPQISISVIIPVLTHQGLTIESQSGEGSFTRDDTQLFINKNNPAKLGVRFGL